MRGDKEMSSTQLYKNLELGKTKASIQEYNLALTHGRQGPDHWSHHLLPATVETGKRL